MPFCPVCSADLDKHPKTQCWNCGADFVSPLARKPTEAPRGKFRAALRGAEEQERTSAATSEPSVLKGLLVGVLLLLSLFLFALGVSIGREAVVIGFGLLILAIAIAQLSEENGATLAKLVFGGGFILLSVALYAALQFFGPAMLSR